MPSTDNTFAILEACVFATEGGGTEAEWEFDFCLSQTSSVSHLKGGPYKLRRAALDDLLQQLGVHLARVNPEFGRFEPKNIPQLANHWFKTRWCDDRVEYDLAVDAGTRLKGGPFRRVQEARDRLIEELSEFIDAQQTEPPYPDPKPYWSLTEEERDAETGSAPAPDISRKKGQSRYTVSGDEAFKEGEDE
jgi:hypothetical protein